MNISFHPASVRPAASAASQEVQGAASASDPKKAAGLSVTENRSPDVGGIPEIDVPDEALSRTDRLGQLVDAAFNLPAPPPDFTNRA